MKSFYPLVFSKKERIYPLDFSKKEQFYPLVFSKMIIFAPEYQCISYLNFNII